MNLHQAFGMAVSLTAVGAVWAPAAVTVEETVNPPDISVSSAVISVNPSTVYAYTFALMGNDPNAPAPPSGFTTISGTPFDSFTRNLSADHLFQFTMQAPAGQQFHVDLPAGVQGAFDFRLHFLGPIGNSLTLTPDSAVSLSLDGVPQAINADASGIDPGGQAILIQGATDFIHPLYTDSFTFRSLTIALDYSMDMGNGPITMTGADTMYSADPHAYIAFEAATQSPLAVPTITVEAVPEPTALGLLGFGGLVLLRRRFVGP